MKKQFTFLFLFLLISFCGIGLFSQTTVYDLQEDFTSDVSNWGFTLNNGGSQTITYNSANKLLQIRWPNSSSEYLKTLSSTITPGTDNKITVEFIIKAYTCGNASNYGALYLLDASGNAITGFHLRRGKPDGVTNKWFVGRATSYPGTTYSYPTSVDPLNADQPTVKITFVLDFSAKILDFTAEQGTFDYTTRVFTASGATVSSTGQAFINTAAANINSISSWYYRAASVSGTNGLDMMYAGISALRSVSTADVTVKFKDQDNNYFKSDEVMTEQVVSSTYNATLDQKASITSGGYYYTLNPSSPTSVVVDASGSTLELLFQRSTSFSDETWNGTTDTNGDLWSEWYQNFVNGTTSVGHQKGANVYFDATATNKLVVVNDNVNMGAGSVTISAPDYNFTGTGVINGTGTMYINLGATDALGLGVSNNLSGATQIAGGTITLNKSDVLGSSVAINGNTTLATGANSVIIPSTTFNASATINTGTNNLQSIAGMTAGSAVKISILNGYDYPSTSTTGLDFAASGTLSSGSELEINGTGTDNRIGMTSASSTYLANTKVSLKGATMLYINANQGAATTISVGTLAGEAGTKIGWGKSTALDRTITWSVGALNEDSEFAGSITNTGGYNSGGSAFVGNSTNFEKVGTGTLTLSGTSTHNGTITVTAGTLNVTGVLGTNVPVTVTSGATLKGTGTINGAVTVNGTLEGSLSVGSISLSGTTNLQINGFNTGEFDLLTITGAVVNGGVLNINVANDPTGTGSIQLINAGSYSGTFTSVNITSPSNPSGAPRRAPSATSGVTYIYDASTGTLSYAPSTSTGVDGVHADLQIYPTLSMGNVYVNAENVNSVDVLSLSGQVMREVKSSGNQTTVNLNGLIKGTYLLKVNFNDNSYKIQRVVLFK
ncbi:exported hypothetical protein [uncultured Paludibacter sp.]|nr:exported hypothetical protein [uncultured Paludibacter sp.]